MGFYVLHSCEFYTTESENVKSRWHCEIPYEVKMLAKKPIPNNKEDCEVSNATYVHTTYVCTGYISTCRSHIQVM